MNTDLYKHFIAVVDAGSFSEASRRIFIAQPALSGQIKTLEQEYGTTLLIRGARKIKLTDAGRILYIKAKHICEMQESLRKEIDANIKGVSGVLHLGLSPCFPDLLKDELCTTFYKQNPDIQFEIYELVSSELIEKLKKDIIEISIIRGPSVPLPPELKSVVDFPEQLMAVYRSDNPWLDRNAKSIPLNVLAGVPLSITSCFRSMFVDACLNAGFKPNLANVCTLCGTTLMLSKHGVAVSIISTPSASQLETGDICCRPIIGKYLDTQRSIVVLKDHQLSAVATHFLDFCLSVKNRYIENGK